MLRSYQASLGLKRLLVPTLLTEQRAFTSTVVTESRKKVKDAPVSSSNRGKRYFKKNWRELAKAKKDPNAPKKEKKPREVAVVAKRASAMEKAKDAQRKKNKDMDDDDGMRPGDFLFHYARFNLGEQALTRPISLHIREAMWQLYDADCDFWTPARLGTKFGFSLEVTTGTIIMKAYEKYLERRHQRKLIKFHKQQDTDRQLCVKERKLFRAKKVPTCPLLTDELELAMGEEFGWMATEGVAPKPIGGFGLFSDIAMVGDQLDMGLLARASFKIAPPPHELPNKPPGLYMPSRQISPPTRENKLHRAKLLVIDIEKSRRGKLKKTPDDQRFMMIRELDGSLRTPSWQERINIQKHYLRKGSTTPFHELYHSPLSYYNTRRVQPYRGKH